MVVGFKNNKQKKGEVGKVNGIILTDSLKKELNKLRNFAAYRKKKGRALSFQDIIWYLVDYRKKKEGLNGD